MIEFQKGDLLYYAQMMPKIGVYNVIDMKVRMVNNDSHWFSTTEKDNPKAYIFNESDLGEIVFTDRLECLNTVKAAESKYNRNVNSNENANGRISNDKELNAIENDLLSRFDQ